MTTPDVIYGAGCFIAGFLLSIFLTVDRMHDLQDQLIHELQEHRKTLEQTLETEKRFREFINQLKEKSNGKSGND